MTQDEIEEKFLQLYPRFSYCEGSGFLMYQGWEFHPHLEWSWEFQEGWQSAKFPKEGAEVERYSSHECSGSLIFCPIAEETVVLDASLQPVDFYFRSTGERITDTGLIQKIRLELSGAQEPKLAPGVRTELRRSRHSVPKEHASRQ